MSLSSSICGGSSSSMAMNNNNNSSSIGKTSKSETVNYLLLYEAMVRHQDLEYDATYDHIALTMGRIQYLGRPQQQSQQQNPPKLVSEDNEENHVPKGMLTYLQMRRCLLRLGYTWNRSLFPPPQSHSATVNNSSSSTTTSSLDFYYDDDVSVMSTNSASTFLSANNSTSGGNSTMTTRDIIATDAQLIMLLTTLVEMEEKDRAMKLRLMAAGKKQQKQQQIKSPEEENDNEEDMFAKGLFLPEFVQVRENNEKIVSHHDILTFWIVLPSCLSFFIIPSQNRLTNSLLGGCNHFKPIPIRPLPTSATATIFTKNTIIT